MKTYDLSNNQGVIAIIPAAGSGSRMQSETPKQYLKLNRKIVADITLEAFLNHPDVSLVVFVIAVNDQYFQHLKSLNNPKVVIIDGGSTRAESVHNALCFLEDSGLEASTPVLVHDAARPCITMQDLNRLFECFIKEKCACLLATPVNDTLQRANAESEIVETVNRSDLVRALTPQMSEFSLLREALKSVTINKKAVTDEVSALILQGHKVKYVPGRQDNIKITHPADLPLAEFYLKQQKKEKRVE